MVIDTSFDVRMCNTRTCTWSTNAAVHWRMKLHCRKIAFLWNAVRFENVKSDRVVNSKGALRPYENVYTRHVDGCTCEGENEWKQVIALKRGSAYYNSVNKSLPLISGWKFIWPCVFGVEKNAMQRNFSNRRRTYMEEWRFENKLPSFEEKRMWNFVISYSFVVFFFSSFRNPCTQYWYA